MFLASRGSSFRAYLILFAAGAVPCGGRKTPPPPVHHHSANYIFWSFEIIGLILSYFENRVPLKPVLGAWAVLQYYIYLHMNRLNKTETAIFISLMCSLLPEDLHSYFNFTAVGVVP